MSKNVKCSSVYVRDRTHEELSFFKLPIGVERRTNWLVAICREDLVDKRPQNYVVCEEHFEPHFILPGKKRRTLNIKAVPTLKLPDPVKVGRNEFPGKPEKGVQTDETLLIESDNAQSSQSSASNSRAKRKQELDPLECRKKIKRESCNDSANKKNQVEDFHKLCDTLLTEELAELVKAQAYIRSKNVKNVSDQNYKTFCLNLYYTSPRAYRLLQNALGLPHPKVLVTHKISVTTEINDNLFSTLKSKVEAMTDTEKICSVVIDAISLKTNLFYNITQDKIIGFHEIDGVQAPKSAHYALVVMIRGILINWKQPVGFALLSNRNNYDGIANWIDKLLEELFDIGLNVKTFVSGIESDLYNEAQDRLVTEDHPYFFVNDRKIYYIFDSRHLIKLVRDNFTTHEFHFQGRVAKYEHVIKFYDNDKQSSFRLASKLSNSHINPTNEEKTKIPLATQLLSNSVATGISTYVNFNVIQESGRDTAEFIKLMNNLFDILNSARRKDNCKYRRAYCGKESQIKFLHDMLNFFRQLKLVDPNTDEDVTSNMNFIKGFLITIKAIMLLYEDLRAEGCTFLFTRRLHLDVLEILFRQIRTKHGPSEPTSRQFVGVFQKLLISSIIKPPKVGCDLYSLGKFLIHTSVLDPLNHKESFKVKDKTPDTDLQQPHEDVRIKRSEYNQMDDPKKNSLFYICCFLLERCAEQHNNCRILKLYIYPDQLFLGVAYLKYKDLIKQANNDSQIVPADAFVQYVEEMEKVFRDYIQRGHTDGKIAESIYKEMDEIYFLVPCPCFPLTYLKKLFIRMRIYQFMKLSNDLLKIKNNSY